MNKDYEKIAYEIIKLRLSQIIINEEYKLGKFKVPIHLALGHESIAVAINNIMQKNDKLILSHRNMEYNLARLGALKPILDEYLLKSTGLMQGKFGSMNLINPNCGVVYTSSILGNNFSVGTGIAMAQKIFQNEGITIILGGDGSIEEGSFHEVLLMLKSLELSTLIIIENNNFSLGTKIDERRCPINLEKFSEAYEIKFVRLSNNDPIEYIKKLDELREYSIKNKTPVCIEIMVTTFGDWVMNTPEQPNGKVITYHAGPTPSVSLDNHILFKDTSEDPIFTLRKYIDEKTLKEMSKTIEVELLDEIK
jgi:acetoin:2,6-dichlorophenolindophenol oxidoreductase subunit alpha